MGSSSVYSASQALRHRHTDEMAWHKGTWWPLAVKEWYAPKASQHMFDPYSLCLLVLGLVFHLLWGTDDIDSWVYGFLLAIGLELVWEIIGNSQFILKRIRNNSGTSGEYIGDSIQNILGDLVSCAVGYILGTVFAAVELWWLSIVVVLLIEVALVIYMRDSLVLMVVTFVVRSEKVRQWQLCKIPEAVGQKSWKQWMFASSSTAKKNC